MAPESTSPTLLPVTVLSGFLGAGKTTLLRRVLLGDHGRRIAVIVNDMSELNIDAALVKGGPQIQRAEERLVEMSNGCICCTLRDDLLKEVRALAATGSFDYLLIESTGISEPVPIAQTFDFTDEDGNRLGDVARLDTMVTVVDAGTFLADVQQSTSLQERGESLGEDDQRSVADLLVDQVEFADVIVLNKTDRVDANTLDRTHALLRRLNPGATIVPASYGEVPLEQVLDTKRFDFEVASTQAGWMRELSNVHVPETEEYGISSVVFRERRPLHPQRFWNWMHTVQTGVVRAKGFFWLATRPALCYEFALAGRACSFHASGYWWSAVPKSEWPKGADRPDRQADWDERWHDRQNQLVLIGTGLNKEALLEGLAACVLTDVELAFGGDYWAAQVASDGFPAFPAGEE